MSRLGHWNYHNRAHKTDAIVRAIVVERCLEQLHADEGDEPMSAARAYDLGADGGCYEVQRVRRGRWTFDRTVPAMPALPTDCIRPYDAGLAIDEQDRDNNAGRYYDSYADDWNERQAEIEWDNTDPRDSKHKAFWAADDSAFWDKVRQEDLLWEIHEHGFELPPVFASRVIEAPTRGTW
jgi:hypothetical protein